MQTEPVANTVSSKPPVDFLWLELTNKCNLQCVHCYADSGPNAEKGTISTPQYIELMSEAFALGCRKVQFIGGEPILYKDLPVLIGAARKMGYEFIEVYTNLTILPEELLQCFVEYGVHVATSVYGPAGKPHDAITLVDGSWEKTIKNLKRVVQTGLPLRASIVEMEMNAAYTEATETFLHEMGVQNVGVGRLRHLGRGAAACESGEMSELCGNCAGSTLCVSPTGQVAPCIMSKKWAVGSLSEASLSDIATGDVLRETRQQIYDAVVQRMAGAGCPPSFATRHAGCAPSYGVVADRPMQALCHPSVTPVTADCGPTYPVLDRPMQALCPPSVTTVSADCKPSYPFVDRSMQALCPPSVTTVSADCKPTYPFADRPVQALCAPTVTTVSADCKPTYPVADRPSPALCPPSASVPR